MPPIRVQKDGHYLETEDGAPFFWLGDTAWQLIDGTTREECSYYLHARAAQGFTVVQTTVLAEFDGLNQPSALGERPFFENDPLRPNDKYFDRVVEIVDEAASVGLYVALLPTWGDKLTAPWGAGPRVFRNDNLPVAHSYARYLGLKLRGRSNVRLDARRRPAGQTRCLQTGPVAANRIAARQVLRWITIGCPSGAKLLPVWRRAPVQHRFAFIILKVANKPRP